MEISMETFEFIVNHVFLPPRLPDGEEEDIRNQEQTLLCLFHSIAGKYTLQLNAEDSAGWQPILVMLQTWVDIDKHAGIREDELNTALKKLKAHELISLHIRAQNAGVIIKRVDNSITVDAFEASPSSGAVMASQGRLLRAFPGSSVCFPAELLEDDNFRGQISHSLEQMTIERIPECMPKTVKAGSVVLEERDTIHPGFVTENFMNILEAVGGPAEIHPIQKHLRDDIVWHSSRIPWRRSSFWLVLKIALQSALKFRFPDDLTHRHYKNFMLFLLSKLTDLATERSATPDILTIMRAKVGRRSYKMGDAMMTFVSQAALKAVRAAGASLKSSWQNIQDEETFLLPSLHRSALGETILSLSNSKKYLKSAMLRSIEGPETGSFELQSPAWMRLDRNNLPHLVADGSRLDQVLMLADLERWVEKHLTSWSETAKTDHDCTALASLIKAYMKLVTDVYHNLSHEFSLALLTMVELWVVLDKICISRYPLLGDFRPEIPKTFLEPLLLPRLGQMERLQAIEKYIEGRNDASIYDNPSIFGDPRHRSFAVQYYNTSEKHQQLHQRIENHARKRRTDKEHEWQQKESSYNLLKRQASNLPHDTREDEDFNSCHRWCRKCLLQKQYERISIRPDEWPLPNILFMAKTVVFELDCPEGFLAWRDTTWALLYDLGRTEGVSGHKTEMRLLKYDLLKTYAVNRGQRLTLGSTTKSFLQAHYKEYIFPVNKQTVYVNNGLQYRLLDNADSSTDIWISDQTSEPTIARYCLTDLSSGPYTSLQDTVDSYTHTHNEVIARQGTCSPELCLSEFIAFGSLRCGEYIQWLNILRELGSSGLSFNQLAVSTLLTQAAHHAGSANETESRRVAHRMFLRHDFCVKLLEMLERMHRRIEANWKEQQTMGIIIVISLRIISLTVSSITRERAILLVLHARCTAMHWCRDLDAMLHDGRSDEDSEKTRMMILRGAGLCRLTYDVDEDHVKAILNSDDDVSDLIESSVLICDNMPECINSLSNDLQSAVLHGRKVIQRLEDRLHGLIQCRGEGINKAVGHIWKGALMDRQWTFMKGNNRSWVYNKTIKSENSVSQSVHYNVITGELLVDGRPLGRVPKRFTQHPLYQRLFGARILRVFASDMPGMWYMTARPIKDRHVHMGMIGDQLLIRTRDSQRVLEVIPYEVFAGDLPHHFRHNFVHWLNLQTGHLELRPLSNLWESLPTNWRLSFSIVSHSYMIQGRRTLVDVRSHIRNTIVGILKRVEDGENIHVIRLEDGTIRVELPRLNLRFFVNEQGHLESKELDAIVDLDQSLGTLHGLKDRLLLRDRTSCERSALIPFGSVSVWKHQMHVSVSIDGSKGSRLRYFRYRLDRHLRKLRSPPGQLAELYLCYLHALTSFVLADTFTGRTGTEEALTILRGESLHGFSPLDSNTYNLLERISELTPRREFYPSHLEIMQQVLWNDQLSQLSQHDEFTVAVKDIISHTARFAMLYDEAVTSLKSRGCSHLLERASKRHSTFRSYEFGGNLGDIVDDVKYSSRDGQAQSKRGCRVYEIASLIKSWPSQINVTSDLAQIMSNWGVISGYEDRLGQRCYSDLINLSFPETWGSLYNLCRSSRRESDMYNLMFLFCPIAFGQAQSQLLIRTLLACAFSSRFEMISAPPYPVFYLSEGNSPDSHKLDQTLRANRQPMEEIATGFEKGSAKDRERRRENRYVYDRELNSQIKLCQDIIISQWPCRHPSFPSAPSIPLIKRGAASSACSNLFAEWHKNYEFKNHISELQDILDGMNCENAFMRPSYATVQVSQPISRKSKLLSLLDLMKTNLAPRPRDPPPPIVCKRQAIPNVYQGKYQELETIISELQSSSDSTQSEYGGNLRDSLFALKKDVTLEDPLGLPLRLDVLESYKCHLHRYINEFFEAITKSLRPESIDLIITHQAGLWALITPQSLLRLLSASFFQRLSLGWKQTLVSLGEAISMLQRAERLLHLAKKGDILGFFKESEHIGREGWTAMMYPDWLLMEIENNFIIRKIQARVAMEMMSPSSEGNSVLQLNMGEGKSSVIIPMVAVALADRLQIAQVITLKPLLRQTEYLLSKRLGGLVNRRIYHTPFSRKTNLNQDVVQNLQTIYKECKDKRGVLITLPEQLLSFRLIGRERLSRDRCLARDLLETDHWLQLNVHNILDESDEILDTRFQLVYTVGSQRMLDGQPDRWAITQAVLSCIDKHLDTVSQSGGVEIRRKGGSFPSVTFLREDAGKGLIALAIRDIIRGEVSAINFGYCGMRVLRAVEAFICDRTPEKKDVALIETTFAGSSHMPMLFLLRGLFAYQVLLFALQKKRWLVDYGLDPRRCLMAVPYRAKGVPSLSSEFGHPDVAILLTCLSYYYTGLTESQLRQCLELILKESDPTQEYARWCNTCADLPNELRDLNGVNLEDDALCSQLFDHFRYNMAVADFYLLKVVFPQEGKEFSKKISSSGWDIPAANDAHPTTGFSGTNDNRFLLPLSIQQQDLPDLHKTNAEVLNLLLRPENRQFISARDACGRRLSVSSLIRLISQQDPPIHVLIDVGAQVLEMANREVAAEWLDGVPKAKAAVFFDGHDEAQVLERDGQVERLVASAFHDRLDDCLIYLDEFHTRGVDLNLPVKARAAVTLGPRLTKDRLVQACMRMRKLGSGQSLAFMAPPDLESHIRNVIQNRNSESLDAGDVVRWSLQQTCKMTEAMKPLWVMQGLEHCRRTRASQELLAGGLHISDAVSDVSKATRYWDEIQEREALSLAEMYGIHGDTVDPLPNWNGNDPVSQKLVQVWKGLETAIVKDCSMHEEQEREVAHEIERQRQIQRPKPAKPLPHSIHPDVIYYLEHGTLPGLGGESSFKPAFAAMRETSACSLLDLNLDTSVMNVYVTNDFTSVVRQRKGLYKDEYLRPVNWVLSSTKAKDILIISPYEADQLFDRLENQSLVQLHIYAPRVTRSMVSFEDLQFYTIPGAHTVSVLSPSEPSLYCLGLFAGSLYFQDYMRYERLSGFLGIILTFMDSQEDIEISVDRFVSRAGRNKLGWTIDCPFDKCPIPFLKALISLRMRGQGYAQSHLGSLIHSKLLVEENFIS